MGSLVKVCLVESAVLTCYNKSKVFVCPPMRLKAWLKNKVDHFDLFSLALVKSFDLHHTAQLLISVHKIQRETSNITGNERNDNQVICSNINDCLNKVTNWRVSQLTDGCLNLSRQNVKMNTVYWK